MLRYDCHDSVSASFGCPSFATTLVWSSSSLPARSQDHATRLGSEVFYPGSPIRQFPRSVVALPSSRVTPLKACPALRPRWCPQHSPYRVQDCCLPRLATCRLFPLVGTRGYPLTTTIHISGLNDAACFLTTSGSIPPMGGAQAGSLLTGWLGVSQVGLEPHSSHPRGHGSEFPRVSPDPLASGFSWREQAQVRGHL